MHALIVYLYSCIQATWVILVPVLMVRDQLTNSPLILSSPEQSYFWYVQQELS